jgi:Flp pilus assembly pilin Flp
MESWSWTWQGVITSLVAALLVLGVPTLLTWIKNRWPQHGELVRYWLTTAAALAILLYATTGYILFAKHEVKLRQTILKKTSNCG